MKLNSPESILEAAKVFRSYGGSWTAARAAGRRDQDGVLVIPLKTVHEAKNGPFAETADGSSRKTG